MHPIALLLATLLAGGPPPLSGPDVRRLILDERGGKRLELVRRAPAETTPPMEGTLELVEAGVRRPLAEKVGAAVLAPDGAVLIVRKGELLRLEKSGRVQRLATGLAPELAIDPGGARVALVRPLATGGSAIEVLELSGEAKATAGRVVVSGPGWNNAPDFAPDGQSLLFVSTRTGLSSVFRVGLDGKGERQLTNRGLTRVGPRFVPPPQRGMVRHFDGQRFGWAADGARWFVDLSTGTSGRAPGGGR